MSEPLKVRKVTSCSGGIVLHHGDTVSIISEMYLDSEYRLLCNTVAGASWHIMPLKDGLLFYYPGNRWNLALSCIVTQDTPGFELAVAWHLRSELGD